MATPLAPPDSFARALDVLSDRLGAFAGRVRWYSEVDSTNDVALSLADAGAPEGCVIVADMQRSGRGRRGRSWFSPPGAGLYASAVLEVPADLVTMVPIASGLAVAEGIERATGLRTGVKWPNDVYVPGPRGLGRKLAGVLVETGGSGGGSARVVVGFGINVLQSVFPPDVAPRVTSIEAELGRPVDRGLVLAESLAALWLRSRELHGGGAAGIAGDWTRRAAGSLGRRVEWDASGVRLSGVAAGIDAIGALLVRTATGTERVIAGEVQWLEGRA
jgi:BirA family biotin operon repressor/biotin-[acetyl-CoA-carboxylase] ligase